MAARSTRPPRGQGWAGPQLPSRLLHPFTCIKATRVFCQEEGGVYKTGQASVSSLMGVILPINNEDLQRLPDGTSTVNTQKLYTDGASLVPGQQVRDSQDGQTYTVVTELSHNSLHGMKRYIVTRKGVANGG